MTTAPLLHTVRETGQLLRIGRNRVMELIFTGELRPIRISNKWLIPRTEIEIWIELRAAVDSAPFEQPLQRHWQELTRLGGLGMGG